jgi:MFS family permease
MGKRFWTFLAGSFCFDFGMTLFFFLYNLFLLDRGFKEDFLGVMMSAINIGAVVCTLPAGILIRRLGLRRSLMLCFLSVAALSIARVLFVSRGPLLLLAFLSGIATTVWAIAIAPAISQVTNEKTRSRGFSVVFSSGIALGVVTSVVGSYVPGWLLHLPHGMTADHAKQIVLLAASAIVAFGIVPLSRIDFAHVPDASARVFPRSPFIRRFLIAVAWWGFATGSFTPLSSAYLSHFLHLPLERIGIVSAASSLCQAFAILAAPFVFRRLGIARGISGGLLACAMALGALALVPAQNPASVLFVVYTGFLWMSEPGLYSLLMSNVPYAEQPGASALNSLVTSVVQAVAVAIAGFSFSRFGYPPVVAVVTGVTIVAAASFLGLLKTGPDPSVVQAANNAKGSAAPIDPVTNTNRPMSCAE